MRPHAISLVTCLVLELVMLASSPATCQGNLIFDVSLDTSSISELDGTAPYFVYFQMTDGNFPSNNQAVISAFTFGSGGSYLSGPAYTGGSSGDLSSTVTLTDSAFLNEFYQPFDPGDFLRFNVNLTTNVAGVAPDLFSFGILDKDLNEIPTDSVLGAGFVNITIDGTTPTVEQNAAQSGSGYSIPQASVAIAAVPEPSTAALLGMGGVIMTGWRFLRSSRSRRNHE